MTAHDVLDYWFGHLSDEGQWPAEKSKIWFTGGDAIDQEIATKFGDLHKQAATGKLDHWLDDARGKLALVILLDQFSRNLHRGTPQAFATDPKAKQISMDLINARQDTNYAHIERVFLYMPLEHSELFTDQLLCLKCMENLADAAPTSLKSTFVGFTQFAQKHLDIIQQFGRFPHRNAILNRTPTHAETEYLAQGGHSFGQTK